MRQMFTGRDNATLDLGRVLWALTCVCGLGLSAWHVIHGRGFDMVAFGTMGAALLAGGGIGIGAKAHTEPGP